LQQLNCTSDHTRGFASSLDLSSSAQPFYHTTQTITAAVADAIG